MALPVSVCAPPQCTVNQSMMTISLMAHNSANAESAMTPASASAKAVTAAAKKPAATPHLNPVEQLDSVVEGRTLRLTATVDSDEPAIVNYEVNGVEIGRTTSPPHQMLFTVPAGVGELYLRVTAELPSGATQSAALVGLPVVADAGIAIQPPELSKEETATLYGARA